MPYIKLSFWLIPAPPYREFFQGLIDELARRYRAPRFTPHITIYSGPVAIHRSPATILGAATKGIAPFRLTVEDVGETAIYTKALFVRLRDEGPLGMLSDRLRKTSGISSEFVLNPHLSLLYAHVDERTRRELPQSVSVPYRALLLDEIRAVATGEKTEERRDVESWREVGSLGLSP